MTKAEERYHEGRAHRLSAEANKQMHNAPVLYRCTYLRQEQAAQYKRGWQSVSEIDIQTAISLATRLATTPGANT